jgi:hypothetical protein
MSGIISMTTPYMAALPFRARRDQSVQCAPIHVTTLASGIGMWDGGTNGTAGFTAKPSPRPLGRCST